MTLGPSFESVLEAARLGSDWAWAVLYGEIAGPVMGFLRSRGIADPQDAAGDVFLELARRIEAFEGTEEDFRTFVFVIAYERLMGEKRSSKGRARSVLADQFAASDISEEVRSAFEALTPAQRDVLSLRIVAGLTVEQTAEVIDLTVGSVKTLQRRGLAKAHGHMALEGGLV